MQPNPPPPEKKNGFTTPLLLNLGLALLIAALAYAGNDQGSEAFLVLFLSLGGLVVLNGVALIVAAVMGRSQWVTGFALSMGLLLLIGLGTCGLLATSS